MGLLLMVVSGVTASPMTGTLFGGITPQDYYLASNPSYAEAFGYNPFAGNLTADPEVNQSLRYMANLEPFGVVPATYALSGGNPMSLSGFDASSLVADPLALNGFKQLAPVPERVYGPVRRGEPLAWQQTGIPSAGGVPNAVLNFLPAVPGAVPLNGNQFRLY